ncbi:ATP-binding protein [Streptomyces flaveolus]|uniref:ATP-binding protein n=1 Tax=Streptomyces flaveolus TaxID=67297 RepID=UPI00340CCF8B
MGEARDPARRFMSDVQAIQGIPVSERAMGVVELVVSELVTNAHKYAPGPCLLDLEVSDGAVEISVWDSDPALPVPREADPNRVGKHGLEIVMAVCRSFEIRREPVGKRVKATIVLADDPSGHPAGRLM